MAIVLKKIDVLISHKVSVVDKNKTDLRSQLETRIKQVEQEALKRTIELKKEMLDLEMKMHNKLSHLQLPRNSINSDKGLFKNEETLSQKEYSTKKS